MTKSPAPFRRPCLSFAALASLAGALATPLAQAQLDADLALISIYDRDNNGSLDRAERQTARAAMANQSWGTRAPGPNRGPVPAGPHLTPAQVRNFGSESLYDIHTLRTLFFEFEHPDWENELQDFFHTDVDIPAKLTVDGKTLTSKVGVGFRGHASYTTVPYGRKRSFNISIDSFDDQQRLLGFRSLNLLNSNSDPTFMRSFLYFHVAGQYGAAPRANFVRVVINGENWGIYVNVEQVNGDFSRDHFGSNNGARWKIPGNGRGYGGLVYLGDDPNQYRYEYEIKTKDDPKSWADLINVTRVLDTTSPGNLEKALEPVLDVDDALAFLAVDKALINNDGYWSRASDYALVQDASGRFHPIPWDTNETWRDAQRSYGNVSLDPFAGQQDYRKALMIRLLAVPALRQRYLATVRDIADNWLDWRKLGPLVTEMQALIADDVRVDTHKLYSTAAFTLAVTENGVEQSTGRSAPSYLSLKNFATLRRVYLLSHPAIAELPRSAAPVRK